MSKPIYIQFVEDLPCNDWAGTPAERKECPMKKKWRGGEIVTCGECGHDIEFESGTVKDDKK